MGPYGFQPRNGDFATDILQKMIRREVVFFGGYGQISDPYAGIVSRERSSTERELLREVEIGGGGNKVPSVS